MKFIPIQFPLVVALVVAGCAPSVLPPEAGALRVAMSHLKEAAGKSLSAEQRAVGYLESAKVASDLMMSRGSSKSGLPIYNKAAADLTVLLRSAGNGDQWNHPLTLTSNGTIYRLRFAKETRDGIWDPGYFTSFTPAAEVDLKTIKQRDRQDGIGGALVGVRKTAPLEPFSPRVGVTAPVTAVLDFKDHDVTLTLLDPSRKPEAQVAGGKRLLDADFSAPLAYYPQQSEYWEGIMGALRVSQYMKTTGLYMLQPYDPERIPLIFVHGLISTPRMWRNVINELETDPVLRERYQCWVFSYPTGNPPAYSAMRFREELEKFHQLHPAARKYVLVGHSMGGIISHMQVTTLDRGAWDAMGKDKAGQFFANVKKGSLIERATIFNANPRVDRAIFICTPHRGSEMATGKLGELAMRMISLPTELASTITGSVGNSIAIVTGDPRRLPNSVSGLSPTNPLYKVLDTRPIKVPYHSIIGDRGKGDTPNSSDGVVKYWSSHLSGAKSEKIVPGPHGACELPATLTELRRLLHLHLKGKPTAR